MYRGELAAAILLVAGCGTSSSPDASSPDVALTPDAPTADVIRMSCTSSSCPEITIEGDPIEHDCLGFSPCFVRGRYDPTIEHDPMSDTLYLAYTSGTAVLADPADPASIAAAHRTHLARSVDHGASWTFVSELTPAEVHHDAGGAVLGMLQNEVSTLVRTDDGAWTLLWLRYLETPGASSTRSDFLFMTKSASSPAALRESEAQPHARGTIDSRLGVAPHVWSNEVPELADCAVFTEPALFSQGGEVFAASTCLVLGASGLDDLRSRNVLLRRREDRYEYVGVLTDHDDAAALGADALEQAALAVSRVPGRTLLLVTPLDRAASVLHQGCIVLEVADLSTASIRREEGGAPAPLAVLTASGGQLGPGLCDYDPRSETGVLLTIPVADPTRSPPDLRIAIHATGVHP